MLKYLAPDSFTPGPWSIDRLSDGTLNTSADGEAVISSASGAIVACVLLEGTPEYAEDDAQQLAAAELIIRAPDMDKALREIIEKATSGASPERLAQIARKIVHPDLAANYDDDGDEKE